MRGKHVALTNKSKTNLDKLALCAVAFLLSFVLAVQPLGYAAYAAEPKDSEDAIEQVESSNQSNETTVSAESEITVGLELAEQATLTYNYNVFANTDESFEVPANQELDFTVAANDGYQVSAVKTVAGDVEADLAADENGVYKVDADQVTNNLTIKVEVTAIVDNDVAGIATMSADVPGRGTENDPYIVSPGQSTGEITKSYSRNYNWTSLFQQNGNNWTTSVSGAEVKTSNGYSGWFGGDDASVVFTADENAVSNTVYRIAYTPDGNAYNNPEWIYFKIADDQQPQEATIYFDSNGGAGDSFYISVPLDQNGQFNLTLPNPNNYGFTKDGYTFVGWSTDGSGQGLTYTPQEITVQNGETYYAIWAANDPSGSEYAEFFIRIDGKIPYEPDANIGAGGEGYFPGGCGTGLDGSIKQGIAINNNLELVENNINQAPSDETIINAINDWNRTHSGNQKMSFDPETQKVVWYVIKKNDDHWHVDGVIRNISEYSVTYDPNGGTSSVPLGQSYAEGANVTVDFNTIPSKSGYEFLGWDENPYATTPTYAVDGTNEFQMPERNVTLYAIWRELGAVNIKYEVVGPEGSGSLSSYSESLNPETGEALGATAKANLGYKFVGWYSDKDCNTQVADENTSTYVPIRPDTGWVDGTTYYAKFEIDEDQTKNLSATVDYYLNGEVQNDDHKNLTAIVQVLQPDTLSTDGVIANTYTGWKLDTITINGEEVEALPETVNNNDKIAYNYVADFAEFSVAGDEWTYDGSSRYVQVDGIYPGDTLTYQYGDNTVTATVNKNSEIEGAPAFINVSDINEVTVTLTRGQSSTSLTTTMTISPAPLTVTTPSASKAYDGTPLTAEGTIEGLVNNETVGFTTTGSQTEVGSSTNTYTIVWAADDNEFTAQESNYTINENLGTLEVTEAPAQDTSEGTTGNTDNNGTDQDNSSSLVKTSDMVMPGVVIGIVLIAAACVAFAAYKSRRPRGRHTK